MTVVRILLRVLVAVLLIKRLVQDARGLRRGEVPATRLIIPTAILLAGALVLTGVVTRALTAAIIFLVDVGFVILCVSIVRSARNDNNAPLELRIARALDRFFPEWFGRLASTDIALLLHAGRGLHEVIDPGRPTPLTYTYGSKIGLAAVIVGIAVVPDAVLFWLLIPHHYWFIALVLDVLDVWACLWLFGALGAMATRPHSIDGQRLVLRNGLFQQAELEMSSVVGFEKLGIRRPWQLPSDLRRNAGVLAVGGVPLVHLKLDSEAKVFGIFRLQPRVVREIVVASDNADGLIALIAAAKPREREVPSPALTLRNPT